MSEINRDTIKEAVASAIKEFSGHISVEDDDGNYIGPIDGKQGNCFLSWTLPKKGDKIAFDDRKGEWVVLDVIHTLCTSSRVPVTLRVREVSSSLKEGSDDTRD
jgi:hypothetical protein